MPFPGMGDSLAELLAMSRAGTSPTTAAIGAAVVAPALLWGRSHFRKHIATEPGHFDTICPECQRTVGLTEAEVEHIDRHFPAEEKEKFRLALVKVAEEGRREHGWMPPLRVMWKLVRRSTSRTRVIEDGDCGATTVVFEQAMPQV